MKGIREQTNPTVTDNHIHIPSDHFVMYGQIDGTWKTSCWQSWQMYKPIKKSRKKLLIIPSIFLIENKMEQMK